MPLTLRTTKGSALTYQELDDNFTYLDQSSISFACSDETTVLSVANSLITIHAPFDFTLVDIFAGLTTPNDNGNVTIDIKKNNTTIFSAPNQYLVIGAGEYTSISYVNKPTISTTSFSKGDRISVDITNLGMLGPITATGLKIYMNVTRAWCLF